MRTWLLFFSLGRRLGWQRRERERGLVNLKPGHRVDWLADFMV
jgi:hypothetical protein